MGFLIFMLCVVVFVFAFVPALRRLFGWGLTAFVVAGEMLPGPKTPGSNAEPTQPKTDPNALPQPDPELIASVKAKEAEQAKADAELKAARNRSWGSSREKPK